MQRKRIFEVALGSISIILWYKPEELRQGSHAGFFDWGGKDVRYADVLRAAPPRLPGTLLPHSLSSQRLLVVPSGAQKGC